MFMMSLWHCRNLIELLLAAAKVKRDYILSNCLAVNTEQGRAHTGCIQVIETLKTLKIEAHFQGP